MIITSVSLKSVCTISRNWVDVLIFYVLRFRDGFKSKCASDFAQISENVGQTHTMIRQAFREESVSRVFERHIPGSGQMKSRQEHAHHILSH
jgi:hypothetical protein